MTYIHLSTLLKELDMSPEEFGACLGVAGITIRRWSELPQGDHLPILYKKAIQATVLEFIAEGRLSPYSESAKFAIQGGSNALFLASMTSLGIGDDFLKNADQSSEGVVQVISQIGSSDSKQAIVDKNKQTILGHQKRGSEWKSYIQTLYRAITSKKLTKFEKFAAYGAFFYLVCPFDLIPDHIPVFGLMDDYLVLGLVAAYYLKRFPSLVLKT